MAGRRLEAALEAAFPLRHEARADAELLALFLHGRDEWAFEALLRRHTPGVRAACRTWLRDEADVDDAAQATFLVLVQRATAIRDRAALGSWLYAAAEPLLNEALIDLPFSYQFRLSGDRLTITNFRMLLAGPNPLGKLGGLAGGSRDTPLVALTAFQALGTALEGTYTTPEAKEKARPGQRPALPRFRPLEGGRPASRPGSTSTR